MSRRQPALPIVAVLCLLLAAIVAPILAQPAVGYGEHFYQTNPVVGPSDPYYNVYSGSTLAQSFSVNQTYVLLNVNLSVRNAGNPMNALVVSIHPDDPVLHVPVMSGVLAKVSQGTPPNVQSNTSFAFNPGPVLHAGRTYWIVCENTANQAGNGYDWYNSGANTYAGGESAWRDPSTGIWTRLPYDLYFMNFGRPFSANVSLAMTANKAVAQPSDFVTFTLNFNNSGNESAARVWINDTLPAGLGNISTSYPGLVSSTPYPAYTFTGVPNGIHSFTITAQVAIGVPPGTTLTNTATLDFANETGVVTRGTVADVNLTIGQVTKQLYLAPASTTLKLLTTQRPTAFLSTKILLNKAASVGLVQSPVLALPFHLQNVTATLYLSSATGKNLLLNLTVLDRNGTTTTNIVTTQATVAAPASPNVAAFTFTFPAVDYVFPVHNQVQLQIVNLPTSPDNAIISVNATVAPSHLDMRTTSYVSVDTVSLENQNGPTAVWAPGDRLVALANVSDPFGSSRIKGVWFNITAPSGGLAAAGAMSLVDVDSSNPSAWILANASLAPPLTTGRYRVDILAMEDNGVTARAQAWAGVAAPQFTLAQVATVTRARAGESFSIFVYYNNTGTGPAETAWLNATLPAELAYVTSTVAPTSQNGSQLGWVFSSVPVGPHWLELVLSVVPNATAALWVRSSASLAFADTSGHLWPPEANAVDIFLNGPIVSLNLSSNPPLKFDANETIVYTVTLHNTGDAARDVWVNNTLPSGFVNVTDTAPTLGGNSVVAGTTVFVYFADMAPGVSWSFDIVAWAGATIVRNVTYTDAASLNYTSASGFLMPPATATAALLAVSPYVAQASATFREPTAGPGDTVPAVVQFTNAGNGPAPVVWINLTLDMDLSLVNASLVPTVSLGGLGFVLQDVGIGTYRVFLNLTINPSTQDRALLQILGNLVYAHENHATNLVPLTPALIQIAAPSLTLTVTPSVASVEPGMNLPANVTITNAGSGQARNVWLNLTVPDPFTYASDTSGIAPTAVGGAYSWHWSNQSTATRAFTIYLAVRTTASNGTKVDLTFRMDFHASNPEAGSSASATSHVTIVAPSLLLTVSSSKLDPTAGDSLVYTLTVQNLGGAASHYVWLSDPLDPSLQFVTYTSDVPATGNQTLNWTLQDLVPGATMTLSVTVRVGQGVTVGTLIPAFIEASYTNSLGTILGYARSQPLIVTVTADYLPFLWLLLGTLGGATVFAVLVRRRTHVDIEDVFLVYRDGVLISHLSRTLIREKDEDVLSGMLTAVQEFVREAFQYGERRELQKLDFGDYRILIERGTYVYLALVYAGRDSAALHRKVQAVIKRIETEYASILEAWDGDMEQFVGARDLLRHELLGANAHDRTSNPLPQYE